MWSQIGLFQENGPCHFVNGSSTPSLNPYSFNSVANMLYVDQPIGTGFSYGTDDAASTAHVYDIRTGGVVSTPDSTGASLEPVTVTVTVAALEVWSPSVAV